MPLDDNLTRQPCEPFLIETERLWIAPFVQDDAVQFSVLMNDAAITRMMSSIPLPFGNQEADTWIAMQKYRGTPGFAVKISLKDGTIIGFVRLGTDPVMIAYALGQKYWGRGYVSEAMKAFIDDVMPRFTLSELSAGVFPDNPASQHVLEKLGFERVGEKMHKATSRLEAEKLFLYRLRRSQPLGHKL